MRKGEKQEWLNLLQKPWKIIPWKSMGNLQIGLQMKHDNEKNHDYLVKNYTPCYELLRFKLIWEGALEN